MRPASLGVVLLLGLLVVAPAVRASPASTAAPRWAYHAPIVIVGDAQFTAANGVIGGSGSPSDPFIIAGWNIDANASVGLWIRNTSASFVLRDSFVHGSNITNEPIRLENVSDATITNTTVLETFSVGVDVVDSGNVLVVANSLTGYAPLRFGGSHDCGALNNTVTMDNIGTGILLAGSTRISVRSNHVYRGVRSIWADSSNNSTIQDNVLVGAFWYSISLVDSVAMTVRGNVMTALGFTGPSGIELSGAVAGYGDSHTVATDNTVGGLPVLYYRDCRNVTIDGMQLGQLVLAGCQGTVVSNTMFGSPQWHSWALLTIIESWDWRFTRDTFYGVRIVHDGVPVAEEGQMYLNNVYGIGLNGNPLSAALTAPYPIGGNYWEGYAGVDNCSGPGQEVCPDSDGFGDTPEAIQLSGGIAWIGTDSLPWMGPIPLNNTPPEPGWSVSPLSGPPSTRFAFNASESRDAQDLAAVLQVRWDWDGDGVWDTSWSVNKTVDHQFPAAGTYTVSLEVRDSQGWLAISTRDVEVASAGFVAENWGLLALLAVLGASILAVLWVRQARRGKRQSPPPEKLDSEDHHEP